MAAIRIFLCYNADPASQNNPGIVAPLLARLQERQFDIVAYPGRVSDEHYPTFVEHYLPTCQWFLLLQTPGIAALPNVQETVHRALELVEQKRLQGASRLTTVPLNAHSAENPDVWVALQTFDGTHDPLRAIERLLLSLPSYEAVGQPFPKAPLMHPLDSPDSAAYDRPVGPARRLTKFRGTTGQGNQGTLYSHRKAVIIVSVLALLALIGSTVLVLTQKSFFFWAKPQQSAPASVPVYGQVTFFSTNLVGTEMNKGIADGVTISLWNLAVPASGNSYYAWLLPDTSSAAGPLILAGQFVPQHGHASVTYRDPDSSNLLTTESRVLITQESTSPAPTSPSTQPSAWYYYGVLPQEPSTQGTGHFSALDHLRSLLSENSIKGKMSLPGGLGTWFVQNVRLVFMLASDAWGPGNPATVGVTEARATLIGILDTLDGAEAVAQDVPPHTPLMVDKTIYSKPLLSLDTSEPVPSYILEMESQLFGFAASPGTTSAERQLASTINTELASLQKTLEQVRQDAQHLEAESDDELFNTSSIALFTDLINQALIAYMGQVDSSTNARVGGALLIFDQLQQLTQFPLIKYSSQMQI